MDRDEQTGWYLAADLEADPELAESLSTAGRRIAEPGDEIPTQGFRELRFPGNPIEVNYIEYRIVQTLAKRPYHAFTRKQIATAINRQDELLTEESVDRHIASLRDKLGAFSDFIQSVPYIGYRFKP